MATLTSYNSRIANEYKALLKVPINPLYRWKVAPDQIAPNVRSYLVTYTNPYPVGVTAGILKTRPQITIRFDLPPDYPRTPPGFKIEEGEIPFLPNVYTNGALCYGNLYDPSLFLFDWFIIIGRVLTGDPQYTNTGSPANHAAADYYGSHRRRFPVGRTDFPRAIGY